MCYLETHKCWVCKKHYTCYSSDKECPTINEDPDEHMCEACLAMIAEVLEAYENEDGEIDKRKTN